MDTSGGEESTAVLRSRTGDSLAVVDLQHGGSLLQLRAHGVELMPVCTRGDASPLQAASFIMLPYSNRLLDGRFSWKGRNYQLFDPERHAIHGELRKRPWRVLSQSEDSLTLHFDTAADAPDITWPFSFAATQHFSLSDEGFLDCVLTLENTSGDEAPFGGGWHPYFNRTLGDAASDAQPPILTVEHIAGVYPDEHGTRIPSGPLITPLPEHLDFSKGRPLPGDQDFDCCCAADSGSSPVVTMEWPGQMRVRVSSPNHPEHVSHLVMYNPTEHPFFAMEPTLNANNGINLMQEGDPTSGITVLEAGGKLTADMRIEWRAL